MYGSYAKFIYDTKIDDAARPTLLNHDQAVAIKSVWSLHEPITVTRFGIHCLGEAFTTQTSVGVVKLIKSADLYLAANQQDGGDNKALMTDSSRTFTVNEFVGRMIYNITDGSEGEITANTATTVTATLVGGTDADWDDNDVYLIGDELGKVSLPDIADIGSVFYVNINNDHVVDGDARGRGDCYAGDEVAILVTTAGVGGAGTYEPYFACHPMAEVAGNQAKMTHNTSDE